MARHLIDGLGAVRLSELSGADLTTLYADLRGQGYVGGGSVSAP